MRTQEQYLEKLKSMRHNIYLDGECIGRDDPRIVKASSAIRMTFSLVDNPEMHDLMTATSHITGKTINRFTHIHQCPEDLLKKQEMTRKICGMCGGCVQRCMGIDMMNALKDYLGFDKIICCGGSWMVKGDLIKNGEFEKICKLTKEAKELAKSIRP